MLPGNSGPGIFSGALVVNLDQWFSKWCGIRIHSNLVTTRQLNKTFIANLDILFVLNVKHDMKNLLLRLLQTIKGKILPKCYFNKLEKILEKCSQGKPRDSSAENQ